MQTRGGHGISIQVKSLEDGIDDSVHGLHFDKAKRLGLDLGLHWSVTTETVHEHDATPLEDNPTPGLGEQTR